MDEVVRNLDGAAGPGTIERALEKMRESDFAAALTLLEQAVAEMPGSADAWNFLGICRFHIDGAAAAVGPLERAVELNPGNAGIQNNLGNARVELGDIDGATKAYADAIAAGPDFALPYFNLASIVKHRGDLDAAEAHLRRAIDLQPDFGLAYQNLGTLLSEKGNLPEAIQHLWKAMAYSPKGSFTPHVLALAYWYSGLKAEAIKIVDQWAADRPDDPKVAHVRASFTGEGVPDRADDHYVESTFNDFSRSFDAKLDKLDYKAPSLVVDALKASLDANSQALTILDAGCGTGKCGQLLKPFAKRLDGVDLSGGMLSRAKQLGVYDRLVRMELTEFLKLHPDAYDAIISADTICYFGRIDEFAAAAQAALRGGRLLVFTVELANEQGDFRLAHTGRYLHSERYVRETLTTNGFEIERLEAVTLRQENALPVAGLVVTARSKPRDGRRD